MTTPLAYFLREHAFVHFRDVAVAEIYNMDYLVAGLTDAQLRDGPHGLNSLAWLFWHMARVEDGLLSGIVFGQEQLLDAAWQERLGVSEPQVGTGMSQAEAAELSRRIDLAALWAYRSAVGRRTRDLAAGLWPDRWTEPITVADIRHAAVLGVVDPAWALEMEQYMPGKTRESALFWWGLNHSLMHLGQAELIRKLVTSA